MHAIVSALLVLVLWPGTVAAQRLTPEAAIRYQQALLRRHPGDARAYYRLADAYVQQNRENGDVGALGLAEQALRRALAIEPAYADARRHLAYVLYTRHDFEGAAREARQAIELRSADPHAWGILGDAALETGQYEEARAAYRAMAERGGDLYAAVRLAGLASLGGDPVGAIRELERAIEAGRALERPAEAVAWAEWQLAGEHFARGDLARAEARHQDALRTRPGYYRALAGLAQVRAAQGRHAEAIDLYTRAMAVIPLPDYAAALGDVYAKLGQAADARRQYDLVEYVGRLSAINRVLYNRELAYFYADHDTKLAEALDLARRELDARRDVYAWDLLAWALWKNGQPEEARVAMAEALRLGTRDARLHFHAGLIERGRGRLEAAKAHLREALATNPHFHLLHADLARQALVELEAASTRAASGRPDDAR